MLGVGVGGVRRPEDAGVVAKAGRYAPQKQRKKKKKKKKKKKIQRHNTIRLLKPASKTKVGNVFRGA